MQQTTFSDVGFLGALRVNQILLNVKTNWTDVKVALFSMKLLSDDLQFLSNTLTRIGPIYA